jgi:acyl-CoA synthetase (AMP-forming)/AMP-acid ligase II
MFSGAGRPVLGVCVNLAIILDMIADGLPDRVLVGDRRGGLPGAGIRERAAAGAACVAETGASRLLFLAPNGPAFPVALFAATLAGVPFLPVNYRLGGEQLAEVMTRQQAPLVVTDTPERVPGAATVGTAEFLSLPAVADPSAVSAAAAAGDPDAIAVLLMTSGTTAAPKSAVLRHSNLAAYLFGSVEFGSVPETDATLVSVPPYHIAAVANALSNLYAGRRIVYQGQFTPGEWLDSVTREQVTHAMVVPTMLARIVAELGHRGAAGPGSLRSLSYGGAKIAPEVIAEALRLFPGTGFVNAYGLTETASSIAVLGPEDHRDAQASPDPAVRARLGSVGRALPSVEIEVQDEAGHACPPGVTGDIVVRGRSDDTIIRGGENIAPAEIEDVLDSHPAVLDCVVAGGPDPEWGHRMAPSSCSGPMPGPARPSCKAGSASGCAARRPRSTSCS